MDIYQFFKITILALVLCGCSHFDQKAFDSTAWKNFTCTEMGCKDRWLMIRDLSKNYPLVGKTKSQILKLLGKPDDDFESPNKEFTYYLGFTDRGINEGSLHILFNSQNIVTHIEVHDN